MIAYYLVSKSLIDAVGQGNIERAKELIYSYGLSYSKEWSDGYTLLCEALSRRHINIAKLLLNRNCKVNNDENEEHPCTPLHFAVDTDDIEVVKMVLDKGARIHADLHRGETPLYNAVRKNNVEITKLLFKHGGDLLVRNKEGYSLIHSAASGGCSDTVRYLLQHGADVNASTNDHESPLHLASFRGFSRTVKLLLEFGALVNSRDKDGRTALHYACSNGYIQTVRTLLEYGSDINIISNNNKTALGESHEKFFFRRDEIPGELRIPGRTPGIRTAKLIVDHTIKMEAANLYVCQKNKRCEKTAIAYNYYFFLFSEDKKNLENKCARELARMKRMKIANSNISFYDSLAKGSESSLAACMRNENVVEALNIANYATEFPTYANILKGHFRNVMERNKLLEKTHKRFNCLFKKATVLPYICFEKISSYLSSEDLKNLIDVSEPLKFLEAI